MSQYMEYDYAKSIITKYYKDEVTGTPVTKLTKEKQTVNSLKNVVQLIGEPDKFNRVTLVDQNEMIEVDNYNDITTLNHYYVDYPNSIIYFHPDKKATEYEIEYGSRGMTLIGYGRIFTKLDSDGNVLETLQTLIDAGELALTAMRTLGDAVAVINELKADITTGNTLHTNLQNDISVGTILEGDLDADISEGSTLHTNLQGDITTGTQLHADLDSDISEGSTLHTNLQGDITTATNIDNTLKIDIANGNTAQMRTDIDRTMSDLLDVVPNSSYDSVYALAKVKDLNIVGYGDSITEGQALPNSINGDGENQNKGVNNFLNTFYMDLLRNTANFLDAQISNFTFTGSGTFYDNVNVSVQYIVPSKKGLIYKYPYNATDGSIKFNYYCKELVLWGIKWNTTNTASGCEVYIDGVKVGDIDQTSAINNSWYPYSFQATTEAMHSIELKNFKNNGNATSGYLYFQLYGISNRKHVLYNEAWGGKGTTWALTTLQTRVIDKKPDVLFLGFGNNDGYLETGEGIPLEQFSTNLISIISQVQSALPSCKISLMNTVPAKDDTRYTIVRDTYVPEINRIARIKNCRLIDSFNLLKDLNIATWRIDNVHPNEYGHSLIKKELEQKWAPELIANGVDMGIVSIPNLNSLPSKAISNSIITKLNNTYVSNVDVYGGACVYMATDGYVKPCPLTANFTKSIGFVKGAIGTTITPGTPFEVTYFGECSAIVWTTNIVAIGDMLVIDETTTGTGWVKANNSAPLGAVVGMALESKTQTTTFQSIKIIAFKR